MDDELYKRSAIDTINRLYEQGKTIVEINEDAGVYEIAPNDGYRQYATDGTVTLTIKFVPAKQIGEVYTGAGFMPHNDYLIPKGKDVPGTITINTTEIKNPDDVAKQIANQLHRAGVFNDI